MIMIRTRESWFSAKANQQQKEYKSFYDWCQLMVSSQYLNSEEERIHLLIAEAVGSMRTQERLRHLNAVLEIQQRRII